MEVDWTHPCPCSPPPLLSHSPCKICTHSCTIHMLHRAHQCFVRTCTSAHCPHRSGQFTALLPSAHAQAAHHTHINALIAAITSPFCTTFHCTIHPTPPPHFPPFPALCPMHHTMKHLEALARFAPALHFSHSLFPKSQYQIAVHPIHMSLSLFSYQQAICCAQKYNRK